MLNSVRRIDCQSVTTPEIDGDQGLEDSGETRGAYSTALPAATLVTIVLDES
ncbi:hypothetical protein [Schlesneria paludicola]|uniref:hypothetical protein n=1 Tax=Schlesneria paludicola TaxID=360056 RepID=UPI0002E1C8D5|nr:hypothetical protein [Schlesneria paludicola]